MASPSWPEASSGSLLPMPSFTERQRSLSSSSRLERPSEGELSAGSSKNLGLLSCSRLERPSEDELSTGSSRNLGLLRGSRLERPSEGELSGSNLAQDNHLKSVDLDHVITLLEGTESDKSEEQLQALKKLIKHYESGIPLKDLTQISNILNLCAEKSQLHHIFIEPTCEILKLYGCLKGRLQFTSMTCYWLTIPTEMITRLPFYKKNSSDEGNYAKEVQESIAQLGYLMRVPYSQVRIQICKSVISFYHAEPPKKEFEVYQPISINYKRKMVELAGLAETLLMSLTLVENQLPEKLWIIKTLQHLSISEENCKLMMKAQAPTRLCSHLNDVDPSGQFLFRSSEILWNLLEKSSNEEIINQLSNLACVNALKEVFLNLFLHGSSHYDRQLRNDILVISTLIAQNPGAPMIETGFAKQLILFATFFEVKSHNPLVKGFKLTYCYEDFELKKLLFNMLTVFSKDVSTVQLLHEGKVMLALFHYVKPNEKPGVLDWSAAQYEELQLHAIATLAIVAPLLVEDYMTCQGNTRLLMFLEWCAGNVTSHTLAKCQDRPQWGGLVQAWSDPFFGQGNSFHGTGGRGNKLAQMRYCLRVLNPVVSLGDDAVNLDLCDQGAIHQLLGILKNTTNNFKEKEDAIVVGIQTDIFLTLSTLCENNVHRKEIFGWEGVDTLIPFMKMDAKKFYSGLGHNRLLFSALDCLWCCVMGCTILEDYFLEREGLFTLLDLLVLNEANVCNLILGILVEFCDNPKTVSHINVWRGEKDQTAANLLINLWRQEEEEMGVKHDKLGRIADIKRPLVGHFQKQQEIIRMPATCPTVAVMDVAENMRAKIYCLICKLGFENLPGLSAKDFVTLAIICRYLDFKVGEIWSEVCAELKREQFRPVTADQEALQVITEAFQNVGKMVVSLQNEMLESKQYQELREEEKGYAKIQSLYKQKEMVNKSWENFLTRTSNYEALKKAKRRQERSIDASRPKERQRNATFHPTDIKGLNITVASGRLVTVESTPAELTGGPLMDTELALKRLPIRGGALKGVKGVKIMDSFKKDSVSVQ
ncbi:cilia- and flagella-associated protein 69-like isoform X2 [Hemicordylus capensis]|uniref:cilia- and flagella-associated protein 69-like isoform X2 n=1 Tax=Hemicordylus capensis TaxID=884348 RepID=UPI002303F647|nr:cilia- and flagella-associated protein 69-like isoform X2 [Hemicordylus capensis]